MRWGIFQGLVKAKQIKLKCNEMGIYVHRKRKHLGKISKISYRKVGEDEITRVRNTEYLGLIIDENLSFELAI